MTDKPIDIKTRKPMERVDFDEDSSMSQYWKTWQKYAKENGVQSVFIMTIDETGHVNFDLRTSSEHHLLLAYATLDDFKQEMLARIFPCVSAEYDLEETD